MIKIEHAVFPSADWMAEVIMGMRNPMDSWDKSDSRNEIMNQTDVEDGCEPNYEFVIGENDIGLMQRLFKSGTEHRKFMRQMPVIMTIIAPLYWWKEHDQYKVGTTTNSCSTMHTLLSKPFDMIDFSFDMYKYAEKGNVYEEIARPLVDTLNELRDAWFNCENEEDKKTIWYSIIQLLPSSYNQRRTVTLNYEVLWNMYQSRKDHKLDEWREFCKWIETIPYFKKITREEA